MQRVAIAPCLMIGIALSAAMVGVVASGGETRPPPLPPGEFEGMGESGVAGLPGFVPDFESSTNRRRMTRRLESLDEEEEDPEDDGSVQGPQGRAAARGSGSQEDALNDMPFGGPASSGYIRVGSNCGTDRRRKGTVDLALDWFKETQRRDGSWDGDFATTGLVLLTYLGAGETHKHGQHKKAVRNGLRWLKQQQGTDGWFGAPVDCGAQAIAALAMAEAYAVTASPLFKKCSALAVDAVARQGPHTDPATWWMLCLRKSAQSTKIWTGDERYDGAFARIRPAPWSKTPGGTVDACRGAEILCRIFEGQDPRREEAIQRLADEAVLNLPTADPCALDPDHLYFTTMALFQVGGERWKKWNCAMKQVVFPMQIPEGPNAGSWEPESPRARILGRTVTTALLTLTAEVYYRYSRVFGSAR